MATALLVLVAGTMMLAAGRVPRMARNPAPAWWYAGAALLLALAWAELLGLDRALTSRLSRFWYDHGWYDDRRELQRPLVLVLAVAGAAAGLAALWVTRRWRRAARFALLATLGLGTLTAIRVISFHDVDAFLRDAPGSWLEPAGAAMALAASAVAIDWTRLRRPGDAPRGTTP